MLSIDLDFYVYVFVCWFSAKTREIVFRVAGDDDDDWRYFILFLIVDVIEFYDECEVFKVMYDIKYDIYVFFYVWFVVNVDEYEAFRRGDDVVVFFFCFVLFCCECYVVMCDVFDGLYDEFLCICVVIDVFVFV